MPLSQNSGVIELTFIGTRGGIEETSRSHRYHSSLLVRHRGVNVMIDCGADWLHRLEMLSPSAIVLTHAHPDHAWGLANGAPCPVYMTDQTAVLLSRYPIGDRRKMPLRRPLFIDGLRVEAFPVEHSTRAPAVGYRISAGASNLFYAPDVVAIPARAAALRATQLYIGDGATLLRPIVKRRVALIGHTPIRTQLGWCEKERVPVAIFTHCGSEIVKVDGRHVNAVVRRLGRDHGIDARLAHDGLRLVLRDNSLERQKLATMTRRT